MAGGVNVEFLGHAGLAIEHDGRLLLCDPWLSPRGAFDGSWFQYPEYPRRDLGRLLHPDAVYVSHEHPDHFDPWFLAQLPREIPIITGRFHKKRCLRDLRRLGFKRVVELDAFEGFEVAPGLVVRVAIPAHNCPPHWFDSCALVEAGDTRIFNLNDANLALSPALLRDLRVDVLFAQASPAIWYPLVYTQYAGAERARLIAQRRESAIAAFISAVETIRPALAIPFAGPPCFFDPELADLFLAADSMFPTPPVAARRLREATGITSEVMKPGDRLMLGPEPYFERTPVYADFDYERDRAAYHEQHRREKVAIVSEELRAIPEASPGLFERFRNLLLPLIEKNPFFAARIDMQVLFEVTGPHGGSWVVDFREGHGAEPVYPWRGEACAYRFQLASRQIEQVLRGDRSFEDVLLSFRVRAHRDPDRYNQHLFTFLKMAEQNALREITRAELALVERPIDTFPLTVNGERYAVQRFCPHAGFDLSAAEVVNGKIVCPGHRWHFDLQTGRCAESGYQIFCSRIPAAEPTAAARAEDDAEPRVAEPESRPPGLAAGSTPG
jgi:UDP-MurNAc hydroxylase